jgi:hypothetical protein
MANVIPTKTNELRALLERLFPNVRLSATGVTLLAAQITHLENERAVGRTQIDHQPVGRTKHQMVAAPVLFPRN